MKNIYHFSNTINYRSNSAPSFVISTSLFKSLVFSIAFLIFGVGNVFGQTVTVTNPASPWTVPGGVTSFRVDVWGGGGAGGYARANSGLSAYAAAGGGSGGAYARSIFTGTLSASYSLSRGAATALTGTTTTDNAVMTGSAGNPSWFGSTSTLFAPGGNGGVGRYVTTNVTRSGNGGAAVTTGAIGEVVYYGGAGANGVGSTRSGGGGGSAGTGSGGLPASASAVTGGAAVTGGGAGANGRPNTANPGLAATDVGGGGGGAWSQSTTFRIGGNGAAGQIIITYILIQTQPASVAQCGAGTATFTVGATGASTWQWQVSTDGGSNWSNISNGGIYSNATTATLSVTNPTTAQNNYKYRCLVNNCSYTNGNATLTITNPGVPQALGNIMFGPVATANGTALRSDATITAATCWGGCVGGGHESWRGRLFNAGAGTQTWASGDNVIGSSSNYLQFDMGSILPINGVATQGRGDCCGQRVLTYTVEYSSNGTTWLNVPGTFTGNVDQNSVVSNLFTQAVTGRYVRIIPQSYNEHMSMRAEIISIPCGGTNSISLSAELPACANTIRWYDAPTGGNLVGTGQYITVNSISTTTTYYAEAYNTVTLTVSASRTAVQAKVNTIPPTPTAISASRCETGTVQLGVSSAPNGIVKWYSNSGLTTEVGSVATCTSGSPCTTNWTTPSISTTTSYWATRTNLNGCESLGIEVIATITPPSTAPTINATICPGGTTVSGTGVNGSTISVIRSGSSVGTATVSGGVWTATVSTVNAGDVITATQTESGACVSAASSSVTVRPIIDWGNLQYPSTASICGTTEQVYGQVYIAGITNPGGATANLSAELGWSNTNSNPNTWTNWTSASFNTQSGNNDEFVATLGAGLTTGTWYYAYRYSYYGCSYLYGGTAGIWSSNSGVATVPSSQTISLSSSAGTNIQTVCKGTSITNITYAVGNGGNNAGVTGLPTGVSGSYSGGTFTISGTPSVSGTYNYTVTTSGPTNCPVLLTGTITVNETLDYANLQFPDAAAICQGGSANVFGKVYESGLTNPAGQGAGITVHCGVNATNTNPNTWSTWTAASFNAQSGNDDEYVAAIGSSLSAGTYYYAFRYSYNDCVVYGGYSGGGGGFWDGSSNISGVLTVNPTNTAGAASSTPTLCINTALTSITHTTTSATGISNAGVSGANGLPTGVSASWSSNTISITGTPSASGTFNYSIPLTGGCGSINATGTIVVTPINSVGLASSSPTLCNNSPLTTITHSTVGASGISDAGVSGANGLPAGVSAAWLANSISITGTPSVAGTFNYSIPLTGGCGTVSATGTITVNAIPTQASSVSSSAITSTTATISFTRGTGANVILVAYPGASAGTTPSTTVSANTAYGSGTAVGTGFVVYNGSSATPSVSVTGLTSSTQYTFVAYEYNSPTCYNVTTTASATLTTSCSAPTSTAAITSFTSTSSTGATVNWTNGNGSFRIVVARLNATTAVDPTTGNTYTANSVFGSGTGTAITGTGNFVVYSGTGTSVAVTGLTANNTYAFTVYEGSGTCYQGGLTSTVNTSTYCAVSSGTLDQTDQIASITLTNSLAATYTNTSSTNSGYISYNNTPLNLIAGSTTNSLAITFGSDGTQASAAWIDFNNNGTFESSESIALSTSLAGANAVVTYSNITIPSTATLGLTRMRVRGGADAVANYTAAGACTASTYGETEDYLVNIVAPAYKSTFISMNTGSTTWCGGETRTVTVTVRNSGTATWSNSFPVNIGVKWNTNGAIWNDYHIRTLANGLAPGATGTYSLTIRATNATAGPTYGTDFGAGTNNLIFDIVKEADCWFAGNGGSCGPGNTVFTSATQTIVTGANITQTGTLAAFGACSNTASTEQTFTVSGNCLSANLVVTAPTGFEVSTTTGTGFGSSVTLTQSSGSVATQTIFVRMASQASSPTAGNITCTSTGATTRSVAVSGTVLSKPIMGTISVNGDNTAGLVTVCPGQTITIAQSGFNNYGGTTYFYSDNTTGLGGWAVAPDWEIINNGVITTANQVAGQNNVNNLSSFSYKINSPGTYIIHTNANNGSCYGDGFNRYITVSTPAGDQTAYGNESWIGYVYQSATAGAFTTYQGYVTESETFNRTHTTPTGATNIHCSQNQDLFTIRYKMTKSFSAGYYTFTVGGDDGVRLSIDGGSTFLINNWVDQGYTTTTSSSVYLNGSTNLVFEYYENSSGAQSSFSYTCGTPATPSAITGSTSPCPSATSLTYSVTNVPGMTYNWTLPSGWSGTSTTNSITVTAGLASGSISVTAQGACAASAASSLAVTLSGPTNVSAGSNVTACYNVGTQLTGSATQPQSCTGTTSASNTTALAIPDNNLTGITRTINVPASCGVASEVVSVSVNITHAWNDDLDIYLTSPSGVQIALALDKGGSGDNYNCTFITGGAALPTTNVSVTGNVAPQTPFSSLGSGTSVGNWILTVADDANLISGTFNSWSIVVKTLANATVTYSWSPTTGLSSSTISNPIATLTSTTEYTMTASSNGCSVAATPITVTVRPQFTSGEISSTGETICTGVAPSEIGSVTAASGGDNTIGYTWRSSADGYTAAIVGATSATYTPPALSSTTSFRRYAVDGTCNLTPTVSTGTWTVTIDNPSTASTLSNGDFVWTGTTSSDWATTANWRQWNGSAYTVPSGFPNASSANVFLPSVTGCVANAANLNASSVSVNNMTIESGSTFTLNNASAILNIAGSITNNGTWGTPVSGSTVSFNGAGSQTIPTLAYSNLQTATGGTKTLASGTTTANGVVTIGASTTLDLGSNSLNLAYVGTPMVITGTFTPSTGTVNYVGNGNQDVVPTTYHHLGVNLGSGVATAVGSVTANGNLTLTAGDFDLATYDLTVQGNLTNNSNLLNVPNVYMSGTGTQVISGSNPTTFENLQLLGGAGTTTVNQDILVNNVLYVETGNTLNGGTGEISLLLPVDPFILDGSFVSGTGTVNYAVADATNILPLTYYNLKSLGAATKTLTGNTTVSNQLNLDESLLDVSTFKLTLAGSGASSPVATSGAQINMLSGELELTNAASALTFPASFFVDSKINDLTLNGIGGAATVEDLTLIGDLTLTAGNFDISNNKLTIDDGATVTSSGGFVNASAGSITQKTETLNANALTSNTTKNLEIDRAGGVAISGNLEVTDEFKLTDGVLDVASNTLKLNGTLNYVAGSLDLDNGSIDFDNTTSWSLPTTFFSTDVKNLLLNGVGGIALSENVKISNQLDMNEGNITVASGKKLEIGTSTSAVADINWVKGTVVGQMKRWYGTAANATAAKGIFPVGTADYNRYVRINFTEASSGGYVLAEYKTGFPDNMYDLPLMYLNPQGIRQYIQNADETGYWDITPYDANNVAYGSLDDVKFDMVLRINNPDATQANGPLNDPPTMRIIRAKGNPLAMDHDEWSIGASLATISSVPGSIVGRDYTVKSVDLQGFSWFNIGGDNSTPLPIELISFTGFCKDNQTTINWKTASEFNSSYYIVEKSTDGQNWREVNTQAAAGISTEELSYQFVDESKNEDNAYYRLTQFDIDGEFTVYDPIFVGCYENGSFIKTYPNPSDASFQVLVNNPLLVGKATIKLVDTKGTVVSMKEVQVEEGTNLFYLNENMAPGIYYISISNGMNSTEVVKHSVR